MRDRLTIMTSSLPKERHGYFADIPYIPPLEASMFFDDLRFCKTHRLPRDHMYDAINKSSISSTCGAAASGPLEPFYVFQDHTSSSSSVAAHDVGTSARVQLPLAPLMEKPSYCSFPHVSCSSCPGPVLLSDRWVGGFVTSHRVVRLVEESFTSKLDEGQNSGASGRLSVTSTFPQTPSDFGLILDDIIRLMMRAEDPVEGEHGHWWVMCNVDLLLAQSHTAAVLGLFLWAFASIVYQHASVMASRNVRLILAGLDDEQGTLAVEHILAYLDRTLKLPGRMLFDRTDSNAVESIWTWTSIALDDNEEVAQLAPAAASPVSDVNNVVEVVAKKAADMHQAICDEMLDGTISVDDAPVVLVWCGMGQPKQDAALLSALVKSELAALYVAEPLRIVTSASELSGVSVPFDASPVTMIMHSEMELRRLVATVTEKGMRLHAVIVLGVDPKLETAAHQSDVGSCRAHYVSLESLRSELVWLEELLHAGKSNALSTEDEAKSSPQVFCPKEVMERGGIETKRCDVCTLIPTEIHSAPTASSENIADIAVFLVWLSRRFCFRAAAEIAAAAAGGESSAVPVGAPPQLSRRAARKARFQARTAVTTDKSEGDRSKRDDKNLVCITVPRALLLGHKDSAARRSLWDALEYLVVTQLCEWNQLSHQQPSSDAEGSSETGMEDNAWDGAHALRESLQAASQGGFPYVSLALTPLGRFLSEDWKFSLAVCVPNGKSLLRLASSSDVIFDALVDPVGFVSVVLPKLVLAACTMRLPMSHLYSLLLAASGGSKEVPSEASITVWCESRGIRVPAGSATAGDISADMIHSIKRMVVLWASVPHSDFAQRALSESQSIVVSRVEALLCAPHATRQSLTPATTKTTSCRGWLPSSTVKAVNLTAEDERNVEREVQPSSTLAADAVATYRFPPVYELCEILIDSDKGSIAPHSPVSGGNQFLCETPIELSELLVASKLLVSSMLSNNCILSQSEPLLAKSSSAHPPARHRDELSASSSQNSRLRTNLLDAKLLHSTTWNSILSGVDVQLSLGGATASGLWVDGKLYDVATAPLTRVDELNHITHHTTNMLEFCDRTALLTASAKVARTEAAGDDEGIFNGTVPGPNDKKVIDEFINTVVRLGRAKTEASLKGKRGFAFLDEGSANHAYYAFHVNKASPGDAAVVRKKAV